MRRIRKKTIDKNRSRDKKAQMVFITVLVILGIITIFLVIKILKSSTDKGSEAINSVNSCGGVSSFSKLHGICLPENTCNSLGDKNDYWMKSPISSVSECGKEMVCCLQKNPLEELSYDTPYVYYKGVYLTPKDIPLSFLTNEKELQLFFKPSKLMGGATLKIGLDANKDGKISNNEQMGSFVIKEENNKETGFKEFIIENQDKICKSQSKEENSQNDECIIKGPDYLLSIDLTKKDLTAGNIIITLNKGTAINKEWVLRTKS